MAIDLIGKGRPGKSAGMMTPVGKGKKAGKSAMAMMTKRKMKGKR